jgi:hypothetical protein
MLTFVCWKWTCDNGWRKPYTAHHVNALHKMLAKHVTVPHRLICITDDPAGVQCETMPLWDAPAVNVGDRKPNCFRRLKLFSEWAREIGERLVSIDLDCVIQSNIDHLFAGGEDFRICDGRAAPYNGSMWMLRAGALTHVWDDFNPATVLAEIATTRRSNGRAYYGSDQAWMAYKLKGAPTWGMADGVYQYSLLGPRSRTATLDHSLAAIVFFAGGIKPWDEICRTQAPRLHAEYARHFRTD